MTSIVWFAEIVHVPPAVPTERLGSVVLFVVINVTPPVADENVIVVPLATAPAAGEKVGVATVPAILITGL
jgi:hypothetical protein